MIRARDIVSHAEMCAAERRNLQAGMNFRPNEGRSVILMSLRPGAPYADRVEDDGRVLIYEGHDVPNRRGGPDPKTVDQADRLPSGTPTENGRFEAAAIAHRDRGDAARLVQVYEKIRPNIWTYRGVFRLIDAWRQDEGGRRVFKFRLEQTSDPEQPEDEGPRDLDHTRAIPSDVMRAVYKRDEGKCRRCGSTDNLHFDHILPFSKGGSSLVVENVQLLCARHNLQKSNRIE